MNPQVSIGQKAKTLLIPSFTGPVRPGLLESVDVSPDQKQTTVIEIDNKYPAKTYNVLNKVGLKLSVLEKNELEVVSALMGIEANPSVASVLVDHTNFQDFCVLANLYGDDVDRVFASRFIYGGKVQAVGTAIAAGDAMKRDFAGSALEVHELRGMAMRYVRARTSTSLLSTPSVPTLATAAGSSSFVTGDEVTVRIALCSATHSAGDAAPTLATRLTRPTATTSIMVDASTKKVVVTMTDPGTGKSMAVYVGRGYGQEVFAGWVPAGSTTFDVNTWPDGSNPGVPTRNTTAAFARADAIVTDQVFGNVTEGVTYANAINLLASGGQAPQFLTQTGNPFIMALKNGVKQTTGFLFSPSGQTVYLNATPSAEDVWEWILPIVST